MFKIEKIVTFVYYIIFILIMISDLMYTEMREILGKVEIETIIKRIQGKKLKQTERNYLSRSIRPKLRAARILSEAKLLEKLEKPTKSLDYLIIYNLNRYGYTFITQSKIKKQKHIAIEELIAIIITKRPKPRYIEALPIILLKNKHNKYTLAEIAFKYNIYNQLGYIIETAQLIANKINLKTDFNDLISYLDEHKIKKEIYLGAEKDKQYEDFLKRTSPKRIKKWNLLGRFFDDDFLKLARLYI